LIQYVLPPTQVDPTRTRIEGQARYWGVAPGLRRGPRIASCSNPRLPMPVEKPLGCRYGDRHVVCAQDKAAASCRTPNASRPPTPAAYAAAREIPSGSAPRSNEAIWGQTRCFVAHADMVPGTLFPEARLATCCGIICLLVSPYVPRYFEDTRFADHFRYGTCGLVIDAARQRRTIAP